VNSGATFGAKGATFNGSSSVRLPDHRDFSVATNRALTIRAATASDAFMRCCAGVQASLHFV
jgi:hypothetical protein